MKKTILLIIFVAFLILLVSFTKLGLEKQDNNRISTEESRSNIFLKTDDESNIKFVVLNPQENEICSNSFAAFFWKKVTPDKVELLLKKASACGTKVLLNLHGPTENILNSNAVGIDLNKFENEIKKYIGIIEPYIGDGTLVGIFTIDEPHDCHDWGFECPEPWQVDEAGRIVKKYWPELPVIINTIPSYAANYKWEYTDVINYQYAFHKGDLKTFIKNAVQVQEDRLVDQISWSIMAQVGGCKQYGSCPMSGDQLLTVGKEMCSTGKGEFLAINNLKYAKENSESVDKLKKFCRIEN